MRAASARSTASGSNRHRRPILIIGITPRLTQFSRVRPHTFNRIASVRFPWYRFPASGRKFAEGFSNPTDFVFITLNLPSAKNENVRFSCASMAFADRCGEVSGRHDADNPTVAILPMGSAETGRDSECWPLANPDQGTLVPGPNGGLAFTNPLASLPKPT